MSKIFKIEITTTVLVEADDRQEASERIANMSLSEIADEMDSGDMVGQDVRGDLVEVPRSEVEAELIAVGNDGTFFLMEDEDAADSEEPTEEN